MPKNSEAEKENDAGGDWEKGIAIKKDIVKKIFQNLRLNFNDENILFYDALEFYSSDGRVDPDFNEDDIKVVKDEVTNNIDRIIKKRKKKFTRRD